MHVPQADYTIEEFCGTLLRYDQSRLFEGFHYNHVKTYFYLTEDDDWLRHFDDYEQEDYGEVTKLTHEYTKRDGAKREGVFFAAYYQDDLLMFFTASTEEAIDQTIAQTVTDSNAIVEMPIVPSDFQKMHQQVLDEHEGANITEFKSRRIPDLADAEIRPDYDRTIEYKGEDGRQTLKEFRQYYGVVPVRIQYDSRDIAFKMDTSGKFTLQEINDETFTLLFKLVEAVLEHVLEIQDISQRIRFRTEERQSGDLAIKIPDVTAGEIDFDKQFNLLMAEEFMERASNHDDVQFSFTDVTKQAGSLDFSATVTDEARNAFFNISATEDSMTIVPKHNCSSPSIVQFYQVLTQTVDESADITLFDKEAAYGPSAS
jgi:hypothetical protein